MPSTLLQQYVNGPNDFDSCMQAALVQYCCLTDIANKITTRPLSQIRNFLAVKGGRMPESGNRSLSTTAVLTNQAAYALLTTSIPPTYYVASFLS